MKEYEVTINIYTKIKNEDITDGSNYLIIAKIYYNNLNKRKEALDVLKSGVDKVINEKQKQEIEFLIEKISREEENLFIGINDDENLNESNNEIEKEKAENNSENVSFSVENNNINSKNNKNIKSKIISENDKEEENDQMKIKDEIKNDNKIEEEKPNDIN